MKANDLSNFTFRRSGSDCYNVTYTTGRGDYYDAAITFMSLIDNTLKAPRTKLSTKKHLAYMYRNLGRHYQANREPNQR